MTGYADPSEALVRSAQQELREEAGLTAGAWTSLGQCHISNSVTDQVGYLHLARGLSVGEAQPDETEELSVRTVPLAQALAMAQASEIVQAFSLVGLYRAWHLLHPSA